MIGLFAILPTLVAPIQDDPVEYSFAFFGCNRVDKDAWHKKKNPSSANLPQLQQSFQDIANIKPMPKLLFMTGDLVLGYKDDQGEETRGQLDAWISEYRKSPLNGKVEMFPLPGNHEMLRKTKDGKVSSPYTTEMWNSWLKANNLPPTTPNGPMAGGEDKLADDQSRLNYSFDKGNLHFVCLNTDTHTEDGRIAAVPSKWLKNDLDLATKHDKTIFILGHRNLVDGVTSKGDSPIEKDSGSEMIAEIQTNPNVIGYLCAHVHAWDVTKVGGTRPWQIIAGNGGSPLEDDWKPAEKTFGFAVIEIHHSGTITLVPYFRPATDENVEAAKPQTPIILGKVVS
ncbi:MAG: hypothetical protein GC165_03450 [Armatimonadetes bacterium]|nr:hypothetical protein [Armatimonadota bacterium]